MRPDRIRIGTRGSDLALWQANHVAARLASQASLDVELVIVHTSGDRDRSRALHELPGSGFFTRELQSALVEGRVDAVVHSLKDLPIEEPDGLVLAAVPERVDARDVLVSRPEAQGKGGLDLRAGARLGTSSARRAAQSLAAQPGISVEPIRGNVPTRVRKLRERAFDAILLAKAGVDRLDLDLAGLTVAPLPLQQFLPSPGQGALAVEARADDRFVLAALAPLHNPIVAEATACERAILRGLGGGCHLPLGAYARREGDAVVVDVAWGEIDPGLRRAEIVTVNGRGSDSASAAAEALAALADKRQR